ncbi:hypothetical protein [Novosphingobium sp.]|jgi:hypothetical protein|uniref:hypothetical protein n=1 Tax=Novosphingobium sp. TaxID=1874826 RepID=UPI002FE12D55
MNPMFSKSLAIVSATLALAVASPAMAAGDYFYPSVKNNDPTATLTITNLTWHGSYNPQLPKSILPAQQANAALKTVLTYGYSDLEFDANMVNDDGSTVTCHMWLSIKNADGTLGGTTATRKVGNPTCSFEAIGSKILFSMSR